MERVDKESQESVEEQHNEHQSIQESFFPKIEYKHVMDKEEIDKIKENLVTILKRGYAEAESELKRKERNPIEKAKDDADMYAKTFLTEDKHINTQLERNKAANINPAEDQFTFQCLDIDHYFDRPPRFVSDIKDYSQEQTIIRVYGVNSQGNSILAYVHNFRPYFFIQLAPNQNIEYHEIPDLKKTFNAKLNQQNGITEIEIVERQPIMPYTDKRFKYLKVFGALPRYLNQLRSFIEKGLSYKDYVFYSTTYESNLPHPLRFMIDNGIVGMSWLQLEKQTYFVRPQHHKRSLCQIEIDIVESKNIKCMKCEGEYQLIAPLRILSFDIECSPNEDGKFPQPERDPVIQIANICQINGENEPFIRNVFTLKYCAPIVGTKVYCFEKEADMLVAWREFVRVLDPDIITGYNIVNFDMPYIISRADTLQIMNFPYFGRIKEVATRVKETTFTSKALGTKETKDINIEGRIQFDMLQYIYREHKLRSYSLNSVSAKFLGEQKEDVQHSKISNLQRTNEFTRRRLAIYCIKDAYLPLRLMWKLECLFNMTEISRVCGVPLSYLFTRGQQIKVASQLYRKANELGYLIPTEKGQGSDGKFEGAVVIEPTRGFYTDPVAILDFASLYPSIMMAHNLCYSTLVTQHKLKEIDVSMYERTPCGDFFVNKSVRKGVLPIILEELITARNKVKHAISVCTNPMELKLLNSRQMALKTSANSVYGFTGAQIGQLPCIQISASVTAYGRKMLEQTKNLISEKYSIKNGYAYDSEVIYGDTDSVMVKFGPKDVSETMELGRHAAEYVSAFFQDPIRLEQEKICWFIMEQSRKALKN